MENQHIFACLPEALLPWYEKNRRDLPWRKDREPYNIWISEIMLQQTRVEAVKGYYTRFLETLPTIETLACADDEVLHKLWEGLGYYSRVRNLKKAAVQILQQHTFLLCQFHVFITSSIGWSFPASSIRGETGIYDFRGSLLRFSLRCRILSLIFK